MAPTINTSIPVGSRPIGIAISPDGRRLYVGNGDGTISVVDTSTNTTVGDPISVAVDYDSFPATSPDGLRLYVAGGGNVSVINTATGAVIGQPIVTGGSSTLGLIVTPNGKRIYVANTDLGSVSVIDAATAQVVGDPIPVGSWPVRLAVSPDGTRVYVPNMNDDTVSVINTVTNTVVGEPISVGDRPIYAAMSPDGKRLYVGNTDGASVSVINTVTNAVVATIPVGRFPDGVVVSPDGTRVYVVNAQDNTLSVIDAASNTTIGDPLSVGEWPDGLVISPDGTRLYATNATGSSVSVINTGTSPFYPGKAILQNSDGDSGFFGDFARGLGIADWANSIGKIFNLGHSPLLGFVGSIADITSGFAQINSGLRSSDPGIAFNGLLDVSAGVAGMAANPVGLVVAVGIKLTQMYAAFWVPIGTAEQANFLNFIGQCAFHKNMNDLTPKQAGQITDRYTTGLGLGNLMSDYANYKLKDAHRFFGQTGCP